jgi:uncharacterized protein (TIGR03382 family)
MGDVVAGQPTGNILFLNRCASGCVITPGFDDSRQNQSSILDTTAQFDAYPYGDDSWDRLVSCVESLYAPFDIQVTDTDPGDLPHFEAIVAGLPTDAGFSPNVGGVAPFACGVIDNSITYTFAASLGNKPLRACEIVAQETAHGFGLDHEVLCEDPMTYLSGCGRKCFQNTDAECGELGARDCYCGGDTQNSWEYLAETFGTNPAPPAPEIEFLEPTDGATVSVGFHVRIESTLTCLSDVQGWITQNGEEKFIGEIGLWPYVFNTPVDLVKGPAMVRIRATDHNGGIVESQVDVTVGDVQIDASVPTCGSGQCADAGTNGAAPGPGGYGCAATGTDAAGALGLAFAIMLLVWRRLASAIAMSRASASAAADS